jgi:GntR family transcriptional repressor for pyruvate dehydrogenase complex
MRPVTDAASEPSNGKSAPPAYQQLADKLREQILTGAIKPGERLSAEAELTDPHGVSRSTVREAIRLLEAQHLVITTRGTTGGSFVAEPSAARIATELSTSLDLLVGHDTITVGEMLEARRLLEVPAARLAAERASAEEVAELRACLDEGKAGNERFHSVLLTASGNPLLEVLVRPLYAVIKERVQRERAPQPFWDEVHGEHSALVDCIAARDGEGAAKIMAIHLDRIVGVYEPLDAGSGTDESDGSDGVGS